MNLLARIKAAFSSEKYQSSSMTILRGQDTKRATFDSRSAVLAYRSWIFAAANLNAVAVASQPLRLYVKNRSAGTKVWRTRSASRRTKAYLGGSLEQLPSRYAMTKAAEYGDEYEVVEDSHPILTLLSKVNPYQNGFDATVLRVLFGELTGNAYVHPVIDPALKIPVELWTMPSQFVEIMPGQKGEEFVKGYRYGATEEQKRENFYAPDEVIHFRRPNPSDLYYGMGKVEAAWGATMANEAIHEMDVAFFANKARPDYLLVVKSNAHPDELERLEVSIDEKLRGSKRTGRFLTTTADIDLKPLSFPPKDLAGREQIVEEIAAVFGVPVSMLKANDPNLASATVGFASWKQTTILPLLRMDEETLNQNLLPLFGIEEDAFLAYDNPVSEDERFAFEKIRGMVSGGIMTANEARMREGLEPIEDPMADALLVNGQPLGGPAPAAPLGMASASPDGLVGPLDVSTDLDDPPQAAEPTQNAALTWEPMPEPERKDALSDCVSEKIPKLLDEGYPQDQAVAIAYSMCREGKSLEDAATSLGIASKAFDAADVKALGDIDTRPPQGVADNARRALEVRARKPESERGMTAVGIARARDLANRVSLSEDTIRRMLAYFERHEVDKQGSTWDEQGKGWQAWHGWGGDDGWAWARRKVEEFNRERERNSERKKKSCGCGCVEMKSTPDAWLDSLADLDIEVDGESEEEILKNCGVGPDGFEQGNECGGSGGGGSETSSGAKPAESEKPKKPKAPKTGKPAKGDAPSGGVAAPKPHSVALPSNPRRLGIDQTESALRSMGYEMREWKPSVSGTTVTIRDGSGKETKLPSHEVVNLIYANSNDPKANAAPALKPRKSMQKNGGGDPPAKPSERISGSDRNPEGSASGSRGGIEISEATEEALRSKVEDHNAEHAEHRGMKIDLGMLKAVYRRGAGAFSTSHRTGVGREQWALARVNAFLYLVRNGKPEDADYTTDYDLLPEGHPKKTDAKRVALDAIWTKAIEADEIETPHIFTKAGKDVLREFDKITEREEEVGRGVGKVLDKQVRAVLQKIESADAPTAELAAEVETLLQSKRYRKDIVDALRPYLEDSLAAGIELGRRTLEKMAALPATFDKRGDDLKAYARTESIRLSNRAADSVNRYTAVKFSKVIGDGVANGETIPQIAERVRTWAVKDGDGERATKRRALTIARTEAQRASRSAEVEAWKSSGVVTGKTWLLAPDPCEFCEAASDAFSKNAVGLETPFYQKGDLLFGAADEEGNRREMLMDYEDVDGPPLHPNCRCSLQPVLDDETEAILREAEAEVNAELDAIAKQSIRQNREIFERAEAQAARIMEDR